MAENQDRSDLPAPVEYELTAEDVKALRELRPRRIRFPLIESVVHVAAGGLALVLVLMLLLARRQDLMPVALGAVAGLWLAGWIYVALFLFPRSPQSAAWLETLRESEVLSTGRCRAEIRDDGLHLATPLATHRFRPHELEDGLYEHDHFFIRTAGGRAIIIPRRAFASDDEWSEFILAVTTKARW